MSFNPRRLLLTLPVLTGFACSAPSVPAVQLDEPLPPEPLAGAPGASAAPSAPPSVRWVQQAPALTITASTLNDPLAGTRVQDLRAVTVRFEVLGAPSPTAVDVEFLAPGGVIYERRAQALLDGPFAQQRLDFELAVAGTAIDLGGLTGTWEARLYLNGEVSASQTFELSP